MGASKNVVCLDNQKDLRDRKSRRRLNNKVSLLQEATPLRLKEIAALANV